MRYILTITLGIVLSTLALFCAAYAQQDVNFYCKAECLARAGTLGDCNSLCSTTDESGNKTKDMDCLVFLHEKEQ